MFLCMCACVCEGLAALEVFAEQKIFENVKQLSPFFEDLLHARLAGLPHVGSTAHTYIHTHMMHVHCCPRIIFTKYITYRPAAISVCVCVGGGYPQLRVHGRGGGGGSAGPAHPEGAGHLRPVLPEGSHGGEDWDTHPSICMYLSVFVCMYVCLSAAACDGVHDRAVSAAGEREEAPGADGGHPGRRHQGVRGHPDLTDILLDHTYMHSSYCEGCMGNGRTGCRLFSSIVYSFTTFSTLYTHTS